MLRVYLPKLKTSIKLDTVKIKLQSNWKAQWHT